MRIKKIVLLNLGSYEGKHVIEIKGGDNKNIVLVGGKNGAGKTTLFDSIRICLYGYKAFGYQVMSSAYKKHILSIINDASKLAGKTFAYVRMDIELENPQGIDNYVILRRWSNTLASFEDFEVKKNGKILDSDGVEDFSSYLMTILPPELFNLFFFDGEQIAEYFLSDAGGENLRKAFLTLCGYDTFAILLDNFYRVVKGKKTENSVSDYLKAKESLALSSAKLASIKAEDDNLKKEAFDTNAKIKALDKDYQKRGGISEREWNAKFQALKAQESIRESLNIELKRLTNDAIPLLILKTQIHQLKKQIGIEDAASLDVVTLNRVSELIPDALKKAFSDSGLSIDKEMEVLFTRNLVENLENATQGVTKGGILNLSLSDRDSLMGQINYASSLDKNVVLDNRKRNRTSIEESKKIREELNNCNVDYIRNYQQKRNELEENAKKIQLRLVELQSEIDLQSAVVNVQKGAFEKQVKELEAELKKNSVLDLSEKAVVFLEGLLKELVSVKKSQVEKAFITKLNQLKQKDSFLSRIEIDDQFFIHAYKTVERGQVIVEQEVDKTRLSKGEKQVFIMALYWALITLSSINVPFMIDTPFARIDTEHRERITKHFFMELPGQVFIFSTNEEICGRNLQLISEHIGTKFLLENRTNTRTEIKPDTYFEV